MKPRVLLLEDEPERGPRMLRALSVRFECIHVAESGEALSLLRLGSWAAVIARYGLTGGSGLEVLQAVRETRPRTFRLLYNDVCSASFRHDAQRLVEPHFLTCSSDPDFIVHLEQALEPLLAPPSLEGAADSGSDPADDWVALAPLTREFVRKLRAAAEQNGPAYVHGETGTGLSLAGITLRQWRREWKLRGSPGSNGVLPPVSVVRVPALRERPQDLPALAARFLAEQARASGEPLRRLSPRAMEELLSRQWYGNVVELLDVLHRAVRRAGTRSIIDRGDLPRDAQPAWRPSQHAKEQAQRDCVLRQLRMARSVSAASCLEGCSRANYIRLMRRLGIARADVAMEGATAEAFVAEARALGVPVSPPLREPAVAWTTSSARMALEEGRQTLLQPGDERRRPGPRKVIALRSPVR